MQALLWETGVQDIPTSVGSRASRWKLIFWDASWILGGSFSLLPFGVPKSTADDGPVRNELYEMACVNPRPGAWATS